MSSTSGQTMRRRILGCASIFVSMGMVAACGSANSEASADGPIKVAIAAPYSGPSGSYGDYIDQAFEFALDKYGAKVGNRPIELVKADTKCSPSSAVQAIHQALAKDPVIVYSVCSGDSLAIKPILAQQKVPMVTMSFAPAVMEDEPPYIWDTQPPLSRISDQAAGHMLEQGIKTVGMVGDTTAYGKAETDSMTDSLKRAGLDLVATATYEATETDFSGVLLRMKKASPDALYLEGYPQAVGSLVKQARNLGLTMPIYTSFDIYDQVAFEAAGDALDGVVFASPYIVNDGSASVEYTKEWKDRFGVEPLFTVDSLYEAVAVTVKALHDAGEGVDRESVVDALNTMELELPTGTLTFGANQQRGTAPIYVGEFEGTDVKIIKTVEN